MKFIAIHDGHNSSAGLMINGKVEFAIQEERILQEKNRGGFPKHALKEIFTRYELSPYDIDKFVMVGKTSAYKMYSREQVLKKYSVFLETNYDDIKGKTRELMLKFLPDDFFIKPDYNKEQEKRIQPLLKFGVSKEKIDFINHHQCHAADAAYGWGKDEDFAVVTADSSGDGISASVNLFKDGKLKKLAEVPLSDSIGRIYSMITYYMGMVPMEHEYKIMGMAPYAENTRQARELADFFHSFFKYNPDGLTWSRKSGVPPTFQLASRIKEFLKYKRFDHISGGIQIFIEEFLSEWVRRILRTTKMDKVALSGGLFMNVKLNKKIMELGEVNDMFVFPSCGDESNIFGALYLACLEHEGKKPDPIGPYYFGGEFTDEEIKSSLDKYDFKHCQIDYQKSEDIETEIAKKLYDDEVVARYKGRMEFGARALGNRSILANPANHDSIKRINKMIKKRDFWMPFAPSMVHSERYIINPKKIKAPYMIMTFDSKKEKIMKFQAGSQPYDDTTRPQEVYEDWNPSYYKIIKEYEKLSGESVILNTSFNLHGYPIVYRPEDALFVFDNSGLNNLAIGNYMVTKKS